MASKRNEKKLSAITELTTLDDKPIKIIDIGQRDKDRDKDNRDREREWNYKNSHHINNNHQQSNHTSHVSFICLVIKYYCLKGNILPIQICAKTRLKKIE